jgi:hypothetical protein
MSKLEQLGIADWPVADKLTLLGELWDSLPDEVGGSDVPPWHRDEVERRLDEAERNPGVGRPWREVLDELEGAG